MINIVLQGRLGNQLFQYAFVRSLIEKGYDKEINLSFKLIENDEYNGKDGWENSLKYFNILDCKINEKINLNFFQRIIKYYNYNFLRKNRNSEKMEQDYELSKIKLLNKCGFFWLNQGYYDFENTIFKNKEAIGCFESSKYFDDIKEILKEEFTPKYDKLEKNLKLYEIIENSESVCVTIRRGDFLSEKYKNQFYVCDEQYFYNGIRYMQEHLNNPQFIIFSDDVEWCKNNMEFPKGTLFEDGTDPIWEKLRLMYLCKNFIISNSTFSWWAQYLSRNDNKIVIAPRIWRNTDAKLDIEEKNWIKL